MDDDRELDVWVQEVTEVWRMPRLRSDQLPWQQRIGRSRSRGPFARVSLLRLVGSVAAVAVIALIGIGLVSALPVGPDTGAGGATRDAATPSATGEPAPLGQGSDALFSLTIQADRSRYGADEPIEIATTLRYIGDEPTTVTSSGAGLVTFGIQQLDGPVDVGPGRDEACVRYEYRPGGEEQVRFQKSGGYSNDDPMADFWRAFFADPELRLPAGEYRITASAHYGARECGDETTVEASIVIVVE